MNRSRLGVDKNGREFLEDFCLDFAEMVASTNDSSQYYIVNIIVNVLMPMATIFGNLLVMLSIWNTPTLHSPSHVLLFSLALADFGVGLLQPSLAVKMFAKISTLPELFCTSKLVVMIAGHFFCGNSLLTLTAISLDRFLAVHLLGKYRNIVRIRRVVCLVILIWVYSAFSAATPVLLKDPATNAYITGVSAAICLSVMLFCYTTVFASVQRQQRQIRSQQSPQQQNLNSASLLQVKKLCVAVFLICCLFLFSNMPYVVIAVGFGQVESIQLDVSATVVFLGSCLNPVVFCWRLPGMRRACLDILRKCCPHCFRQRQPARSWVCLGCPAQYWWVLVHKCGRDGGGISVNTVVLL